MQSFAEVQSMATRYFSAYASMAATVMLFRSIANDAIPQPIRSFFLYTVGPYLLRLLRRFFPSSHKLERTTLVVDEKAGLLPNQIYESAEIYLQTKLRPDSDRLRVHKTAKQKTITLGLVQNLPVEDRFAGFDLTWQFVHVEPVQSSGNYRQEKRYFELSFDKSNRETVVNDYLPLVLLRAKEIKEKDRTVRLYSTRQYMAGGCEDEPGAGRAGLWGYVNLDHPATFETLAMDHDLKRALIEDLDRFVRRRDYYRRVGKAWKRGYLLYGPPGTGKSSLVAAMANYLKFDVYDLELTGIYSNMGLQTMLLNTNNRSIVVIEDIDCSRQMQSRNGPGHAALLARQGPQDQLTLSGLLNFIDGLWSTCGDERIIVFTTNHKEKIDPALLRPGRMDMHISMGYCTAQGFDTLAKNYLGVVEDHHPMIGEIKDLIGEIEITPAEVAEHLMRNEDADMALEGVVDLLKKKKDEKINARTEDNKTNDDVADDEGNRIDPCGYGHDFANGHGPLTDPFGYGHGFANGYRPLRAPSGFGAGSGYYGVP
ncbi:P-loop containing nucleoside triphosphatehydrolases superfamily protein [Striga asiatica]|uniref:P-loop containing nucleoside triphosphatehydrolases superfamily protein n=1 Tax=Striga asiatica TaxID=4170 RepID=A0A5A7P672_STRAF|nr:P-loop containing nucleoside triphosphatehydrolases superfamily protein [Striga asiatica]